MISLIGWLGAGLLLIYELIGIFNDRVPTISQIIWELMKNKWFRFAFTFTWAWLTLHFFIPEWFG